MDQRLPAVHNPASAGASRRGILNPMKPFTLACARVGLCICCFVGASQASASEAAEHPLAPLSILATLETAAPPAPIAASTEAQPAPPAAPSAAPSLGTTVALAGPAGAPPGNDTVLRAPRAVGGVSAGFLSTLDHGTFKPGTWDNSFFERAGRDLGSPASLLGGTALLWVWVQQTHRP